MNFTIRKANNNDINNILNILSPYVKQGILLPRNTDDIANNLSTFSVAVTPKKLVGVISFYKYNNKLYEIRSL
nr:GNAT family N-acetyltransferase [Spirochaetota bacterium]